MSAEIGGVSGGRRKRIPYWEDTCTKSDALDIG